MKRRGGLNFAVIGVAGYVAPRHLDAIRATDNRLVAALDPHDAVGVLDRYALDAKFFTDTDWFSRHLEMLANRSEADRVHWVSVCSPNDLHDAHIRMALGVGADLICEKPLVIDPRQLDPLRDLEARTGRRVRTVLQLRLHPKLVALKETVGVSSGRHDVELTYITTRGPWYDVSWKGSEDRSGGIVTNIGIHLFDLLLWLFGPAEDCVVQLRTPRSVAGVLEMEHARVRWFLSTDAADLPFALTPGRPATHRLITVDGSQVEFSEGFGDLHTQVYEQTLAGRGFSIDDARPSIELAARIRATMVTSDSRRHSLLAPQI